MWTRFRKWLWELGLRYPAQSGWEALVQEVASVDLWQKDGLFGLPLEWTLLRRDLSGRVVPLEGVCEVSGVPISGLTPMKPGPNGPVHDLSAWGVRCARCGVPLLCKHAGMKFGNDVPSCSPCRRAVTREVARARGVG